MTISNRLHGTHFLAAMASEPVQKGDQDPDRVLARAAFAGVLGGRGEAVDPEPITKSDADTCPASMAVLRKDDGTPLPDLLSSSLGCQGPVAVAKADDEDVLRGAYFCLSL